MSVAPVVDGGHWSQGGGVLMEALMVPDCSSACPVVTRLVLGAAHGHTRSDEAATRLAYGIAPERPAGDPTDVAAALQMMAASRPDPVGWLDAVVHALHEGVPRWR